MVCIYIVSILLVVAASEGKLHYRLPTNLVPERYKLKIKPDLGNWTFEGDVQITVNCVESTNTVIVHVEDLRINNDSLEVLEDGMMVPIRSYLHDGNKNIFVIKLDVPMKNNTKYIVRIQYHADMKDCGPGFYRMSFVDRAVGKTRWAALTEFLPGGARKAFPCFDDPVLMARFQISIGVQKSQRALSNMPLKDSSPMRGHPGWRWHNFEESVPMSTHSVAFVVSDFLALKGSPSGRQLRVWAREDALQETKFAGEVGQRVMGYFGKLLQMGFPLPKQDIVALPRLAESPSDSWGLAVHSEEFILYDPTTSSSGDAREVAMTVAHELAHQWLGYLLTQSLWADMWLNDALAAYVTLLGIHQVKPQWNVVDYYGVAQRLETLSMDSSETSHAMVELEVAPTSHQFLDSFRYLKGVCLLRMLNKTLGERTFTKSLRRYLQEVKKGEAKRSDIWTIFTEVAHKERSLSLNFSLKVITDSWTRQPGFPLVTVTRNYEQGTATISQKRFFSDKAAKAKGTHSWWIPLTFTDESYPNFEDATPKAWLRDSKDIVILGLPDEEDWVIFNIQAAGLYRVNYDPQNWALIARLLKSKRYTNVRPLTRAGIVSDVMELARAGHVPYSQAFRLLEYLVKERDYMPWKAAFSSLEYVKSMLEGSEIYGSFKKFMSQLLSPLYEYSLTLSPSEDSIFQYLLSADVTKWACEMDVKQCLENTSAIFKQWVVRQDQIPSALRRTVYCTAIRKGDEVEWKYFLQMYSEAKTEKERNELLYALACTETPRLLQRYLEDALGLHENMVIKSEDIFTALTAICERRAGYILVKGYLIDNFTEIYDLYSSDITVLSEMIQIVARRINEETDYDQLESLSRTNSDIFSEEYDAIEEALKRARANVDWVGRNHQAIGNALSRAFQKQSPGYGIELQDYVTNETEPESPAEGGSLRYL